MYKAYIKSVVNVGAFQSNTLSKTDSGNKDILAHTKSKQMKKLPLNSSRQHGVYTDIYVLQIKYIISLSLYVNFQPVPS